MMNRLPVCLLALFATVALSLPARAVDTYTPDAAHSTLGFKVRHLGVSTVRGQFDDFTGKVLFDPADPNKCSVELTVQAKSVNTANAKRDEHLRGADFFNVAEFPTLGFKSTAVRKIDDTSYEVAGNFTLHGVTKPITILFTDIAFGKGMKGETRAGGTTRFVIKRSDYGMDKMIGPVGDEVTVELSFEAVKS